VSATELEMERIKGTDSFLRLDMTIYPFRIRHVLQHHLTNLQRRLPEADFQNLNIPSLQGVSVLALYHNIRKGK